MIFKFEDYIVEPEIRDKKIKRSIHTGKELETLNISFETDQRFEKPEFIYSDDKTWKLLSSSYSYTEGEPIIRYNWKIEEVEELKITKLIVNGLEFEPSLYNEEIEETNGNALIITAVIEINVEMWENIKSIPSKDFFSVIRRGISDKEKEMRWGRILWSKQEDTIRCRMVLVEKIYDEYNTFIGFSEPELSNIERNLLKTSEKVDRLLYLLVDKGIITNEEQEMIKTVNKEDLDFYIFDKVENLDKFLEDSGQLEELKKV